MARSEEQIKILKNAIQEVYSYIYWELPMRIYREYDQVVEEIMKKIEQEEKENDKK